MKKNLISIHFDGPIARDHAIQLRTFAKTLGHIQTAIDRAFLDIKYGSIWKYARLSEDDYEQTDFLLQQTREGGFIADLIGSDESNKDTITRINNAVAPAYEQSNSSQPIEQEAISDQLDSRKRNYNAGVQEPVSYETLIHNPDPAQTRAYGDRSIVKEFDQIASAIRARDGDGSLIEIDLYAGKSFPKIVFHSSNVENFHKLGPVHIFTNGPNAQASEANTR